MQIFPPYQKANVFSLYCADEAYSCAMNVYVNEYITNYWKLYCPNTIGNTACDRIIMFCKKEWNINCNYLEFDTDTREYQCVTGMMDDVLLNLATEYNLLHRYGQAR